MSDRCETMSGVYRCALKPGHAGACEAQAREYAATSTFAQRHGYHFDLCKVHGLAKFIGNECAECKQA